MQCNINSRGRKVRIVNGSVCCFGALVAAGITATGHAGRSGLAFAAVAMAIAGVFQIFEGVLGWCALRAMGIRTRL